MSIASELFGTSEEQETNREFHILIVEDEAAIREIYFQALSLSGYRVQTAEDGVAAWELLRTRAFDLIITDNNMPRLTGLQLIDRVRTAGLTLPVIMASGIRPDVDLDSRQVFFLPKPVTFQMVLEKVKEILPVGSGVRSDLNHRN
jgi:CheY-like chemotaxis protein